MEKPTVKLIFKIFYFKKFYINSFLYHFPFFLEKSLYSVIVKYQIFLGYYDKK